MGKFSTETAPYTTKNNESDEKQGIGKVSNIPVYNYFNKGNQTIKFCLKQRRYIDLNFSNTDNENQGFVIPYQSVGFWLGNVNADHNQNWKNYLAIASISWGQTWVKGRYSIEPHAVTRQRLLQTGETNTLTWDFETSQNLIWCNFDRQPTYYPVNGTQGATIDQYTIGIIKSEEPIWDIDMDPTTYEQIPQRERKIVHITFEHPGHGFVYPTVNNNQATVRALIPGRDRISKIAGSQNYSSNSNLVTTTENQGGSAGEITTVSTLMDKTKAYPMHMLAQPKVPDETGYMKFRYQIHYETELELLMHIRPDYRKVNVKAENLEDTVYDAFEKRFIVPYATVPGESSAPVFCFPYNLTA